MTTRAKSKAESKAWAAYEKATAGPRAAFKKATREASR